MFTNDKYLGPTLLMMNKMMADFKIFLFLFIVVMLGFGVGYIILLSDPVDFIDNPQYSVIIRGLFFYPFFQMFGELFVDDLYDPNPTFIPHSINNTVTNREIRGQASIVFVGLYMVIVLLMLVNVLIAMFSDTFRRVKDNQSTIWKFQRLELLKEMEIGYMPPPISFFHFIISQLMKAYNKEPVTVHRINFTHKQWLDTVIRSAVVDSLEDYLKSERNLLSNETPTLITANTSLLKKKISKLELAIRHLSETVEQMNAQTSQVLDELPEEDEG